MSEVLVLVDIVDGHLRPVNAEMLAFAARLGTPAAVVVGAPGTAAAHREQLAGWGAETVYAAESDDAPQYLITPQVTALATIAARAQPAAVLLPLTVDGRETAGRLAVRLDGALLSDVVDIADDGTVTHSVYGGSYTVHARASAGIPVITVRPNSLADPAATSGAGTLTEVPLTFDTATATRILQTETEPVGDRPDLAAASVVVSGGRGVGSADNFAIVEELADALGGAVGASRAAVDSGYYPHQFQVGQTGTSVSPQLYIGLGISGAIQHRAGMQTSKTIIAVNKDADAPIFDITDLGIVGDLFTVAPQLAEAVKARKS